MGCFVGLNYWSLQCGQGHILFLMRTKIRCGKPWSRPSVRPGCSSDCPQITWKHMETSAKKERNIFLSNGVAASGCEYGAEGPRGFQHGGDERATSEP